MCVAGSHLAQWLGLWAQALEVPGSIPNQRILCFSFFFCLSFVFIHVTAEIIATAFQKLANKLDRDLNLLNASFHAH